MTQSYCGVVLHVAAEDMARKNNILAKTIKAILARLREDERAGAMPHEQYNMPAQQYKLSTADSNSNAEGLTGQDGGGGRINSGLTSDVEGGNDSRGVTGDFDDGNDTSAGLLGSVEKDELQQQQDFIAQHQQRVVDLWDQLEVAQQALRAAITSSGPPNQSVSGGGPVNGAGTSAAGDGSSSGCKPSSSNTGSSHLGSRSFGSPGRRDHGLSVVSPKGGGGLGAHHTLSWGPGFPHEGRGSPSTPTSPGGIQHTLHALEDGVAAFVLYCVQQLRRGALLHKHPAGGLLSQTSMAAAAGGGAATAKVSQGGAKPSHGGSSNHFGSSSHGGSFSHGGSSTSHGGSSSHGLHSICHGGAGSSIPGGVSTQSGDDVSQSMNAAAANNASHVSHSGSAHAGYHPLTDATAREQLAQYLLDQLHHYAPEQYSHYRQVYRTFKDRTHSPALPDASTATASAPTGSSTSLDVSTANATGTATQSLTSTSQTITTISQTTTTINESASLGHRPGGLTLPPLTISSCHTNPALLGALSPPSASSWHQHKSQSAGKY